MLFASVGGRKNADRRFAGRGAVDGGDCPGARSGESHHLPGAAAERTPFGRVLAASRRRSLSIAQGAGREAILEREAPLRLFVGDRLAEGWTPEQISGWLKSGNEPRLRAIGCETIYAVIYRTAQKAAALWCYLTRRHKRRRPRRARAARDAIKDRASIHDRPKTIEGRGEAGHWEGDLIICKCARPVLVLHERKSRVTLDHDGSHRENRRRNHLSDARGVRSHRSSTAKINHLRQRHQPSPSTSLLRTMRDMTTWFCDAYASWQKGGIENANGRLRRWLPRHLDIDRTSDQEIQEIVLTTNLTPRKCLRGSSTPFQVLIAELGKDVQIRFS